MRYGPLLVAFFFWYDTLGQMWEAPVLVVARFKESLDWLENVPSIYKIVVYNKSQSSCNISPSLGKRVVVRQVANVGKEADSYCRYIVENYDSLPRLVVFAQGDPFPHSPDFLTLLREYASTLPLGYRPLTRWYLPTIPPEDVFRQYSSGGVYVESMSCYTLASIRFYDAGVEHLQRAYLKAHGLPEGTNIMHDYFRAIGLKDAVPQDRETPPFNYSAMFAVDSASILSRPRAVYEAMIDRLRLPDWFEASIAERAWMTLFCP